MQKESSMKHKNRFLNVVENSGMYKHVNLAVVSNLSVLAISHNKTDLAHVYNILVLAIVYNITAYMTVYIRSFLTNCKQQVSFSYSENIC